MKYVDEYRDAKTAQQLAARIEQMSAGQPLKLMEVCGGHTHTIFKHGIEDVLPRNIDLIHGPGCPVCVLPMGRIDDALAIAQTEDVIFTTFGDMMRVPGSKGSLLDAKAAGADVRFVYSPLDALKIARQNPAKEVVFFAIGFETTAPSTAVTLLRAQAERIKNFSIFCNHVTIIPAIKATAQQNRSQARPESLHRRHSQPIPTSTALLLWPGSARLGHLRSDHQAKNPWRYLADGPAQPIDGQTVSLGIGCTQAAPVSH